MMRYLYFIFLFATISSSAQRYFYEDFNYDSAAELDSLFLAGEGVWGTHLAMPDIDINKNGRLDSIEKYKRTSIVTDPLDPNNKVIKMELHKVDPYFYSQHFCSDYRTENVLTDSVLQQNYNFEKRLYCVDCSDSPLKLNRSGNKTHMNRNEIHTHTLRRYMYKPKKEHWFGMRMLIDKDYELDTIKSGEIVTQFHLKAGKGNNPPIALIIDSGRFKLTIIKNDDGKGDYYDLGPVIKNEWINWKWHVVVSDKDKNGLVEVWRNDEKWAIAKGKNIHKNTLLYFKFGVYKWGWWSCRANYNYSKYKAIYFDKVWVNNEDKIKL